MQSSNKVPPLRREERAVRRVAGAGALRVADIWKGAKRDELELEVDVRRRRVDGVASMASRELCHRIRYSLKAAAEKNADLRATLGVSAAQNSDIKPKASKAPASILSPADVRGCTASRTTTANSCGSIR